MNDWEDVADGSVCVCCEYSRIPEAIYTLFLSASPAVSRWTPLPHSLRFSLTAAIDKGGS